MFFDFSVLRAACVYVFLITLLPGITFAERIKDIASVSGIRANQLIGYGIVVGLDGTGDQTSQTQFTVQSIKSMLTRLGVAVPQDINPQLKNVAAVIVHAELPPFSKIGQKLDITVSSVGNAKSLKGGSLIMTPLSGIDGRIYAIAQGSLIVGGLSASGSDGSKITVNNPSVGTIPGGAVVEKEVGSSFANSDSIQFNLHAPDFTTARRLADSINDSIGEGTARAIDATSIVVSAPRDPSQRVIFASMLEELEVVRADAAARVIVNSRTGTVVIGSNVRVKPAAVSHGKLTVTVSEDTSVSQPNIASGGVTETTPESSVVVNEGGSKMFVFDPGVSLNEIVRAVNKVGASPSDLVAILEALKQAGALGAELIVI